MTYINPNNFIQFELWKTCSIGCKFCCNKGQKETNKLESLNFVLEILDSDEIKNYNEIGFIGGEFFNTELDEIQVKELFYLLFKKLTSLSFDKIYIATSLIFDINKHLIPFLNYLKKLSLLNKVMLCTSYDLKYRFRTNKEEVLWKNNMLLLKEKYPELTLHTEIILTEWFLQAVLNNTFDINVFKKTFNCNIDYIEPSSGLFYKDKKECEKACPGFFPKLNTFITFIKYCLKHELLNFDTFLSMELRSNTLYFLENNTRRKSINRRKSDGRCELLDKTKKYDIGFIDSDKKMYSISKDLFNMLKG